MAQTNPIILRFLYDVTPEELSVINNRVGSYPDDTVTQFCQIYKSRRKDPQLILISCLLGFIGFAGIHRLITNHIGLGILYLFTAGLCFIGTIIDLINYKDLAQEYNGKMIAETLAIMNIGK